MGNTSINCDGQVLDAVGVRDEPTRFSRQLQSAKAQPGFALCLCRPDLRLQIREKSGAFHLAVWPREGGKHDEECFFYRDFVHDQALAMAQKNSISVSENGLTTITPDFALKRWIAPGTTRNKYEPTGNLKPGTRRAALLSILHHLWSESLNNRCFGFGRDYKKSFWHVVAAMGKCKLGSIPMRHCTYVPGFSEKLPKWAEEFDRYLAGRDTEGAVHTGLVLGELKEMGAGRIQLVDMPISIFATNNLMDSFERRFPGVFSTHRHGERVMFVGQVERAVAQESGRVYFRLVSAAFMVTSRDYIPVDSGNETLITNALVRDGRRFVKPLKVEDGVMPDFLLTDTPVQTYMEVWGLDSPEYLQRKRDKQLHYKKLGVPLWEWDVLTQTSPPTFPARS